MGIITCGNWEMSPPILNKRFGVIGKRLQEMGLGMDDQPVIPLSERKKPNRSVIASPLKKIPPTPLA